MASDTTTLPRLRRGTRIGKYLLQRRLGEGGFASVWKAKDTIEDDWVALKIPHPLLPGSDGEGELLREIRLGARLDHPNILRVKNADRVGSLFVIATDLAIESLDDRLTRRFAIRRALILTRQLVEGLAYAHQHRVVHRDLKPPNLMLYEGDRLRIADFGLAKIMRHTMISATGSGSILYAAPEQMHGYPCLASDVFSAGLIIFQMLTGSLPRWPFRWPFERHKVLVQLAPELVPIIRRAVRVDHRYRYADATRLRVALERVWPKIDKRLNPQVKKPRRRRPALGAWRDARFRECKNALGKSLGLHFNCPRCEGPIAENMRACPWCRSKTTRFAEASRWPLYCPRCNGGMREEWRFCPWCWGGAYADRPGKLRADSRYDMVCRSCKEPMQSGMRYCPWCHARHSKPVRIAALVDKCPQCKSAVALALWDFCPWCTEPLGKSG
ncbi:MAG: hypothetical protein A2289_01320 [Deltaproteobacteria bacterium RIFOXYA12_FULL_58_15]|nr:MAG: hypothetical protein A2289_01320 [Deltaproteobacteria bacterium RIFOXYA12_FULL_58_15]OGR14029.1 MAG: hypothetical protein A2341_18975 [Deltaproteobacteria bacterium RIFOXYB12_FULL_58_9]